MLKEIISTLQKQRSFRDVLDAIEEGKRLSNLGLHRAVRLPVLSALHCALNFPLLLISDRSDYALTLADELSL